MQTQKDHVAAHQFMTGRMVSALVSGDLNRTEIPARRGRHGVIMGIVLAVLAAAGFAVYGLVVPGGNTAYQQAGAILVEKETGTRYVFTGGQLRPTLNEASALLFEGQNGKIDLISQNSLKGLPHGAPIGIVGAPDPVPTPADLLTGPWLMCLPSANTSDTAIMDVDLAGSTPTSAVGANQYVVVTAATGQEFVVWHGAKYQVTDSAAPVALGFANVQSLPAPSAWLDALRNGGALAAATITGAGQQGPQIAGQTYPIGQLFTEGVGNGTQQSFVLGRTGLQPVSATEFALLAAQSGAAAPVPISASTVASAQVSADDSLLHAVPDLIGATALNSGAQPICVRQQGAGTSGTSVVVAQKAFPSASNGSSVNVSMTTGHGMLVTTPAAAQAAALGGSTGPEFLINDQGIKFLIPDSASTEALGFGNVKPVPMSTELLAEIPSGPTLSRAAAAATQEG
ncbi:MAG TPA: type VII secretion protein EccB [Pseudonocardiaceae bacterium]|nr:type VII secretion protein EccB [Pseudonocardiaceae bacterium]